MSTLEIIASEVATLNKSLAERFGNEYKVELGVTIRSRSAETRMGLAEDIKIAAAAAMCISVEELVSTSRAKHIVTGRELAAYAMFNVPDPFSKTQIGSLLNRDHATVINMLNIIDGYVKNNDGFFKTCFNNFLLNLPTDIVIPNPYGVNA